MSAATPFLDALQGYFTDRCPRCGHASVHRAASGTERCGWPDCDWPRAPRDHCYLTIRDGALGVTRTRIERSAQEPR